MMNISALGKILLISNLFITITAFAQPYIDLVKTSYDYTPSSGLNKKDNPLKSGYYNINLTAPIELQKNSDAIIINPFFERDEGKISNSNFHVMSEGSSLGFFKKIKTSGWNVYAAFIIKHNKEIDKNLDDAWQYGGAILTSYEKSKSLTLKFGLYYNKEFFGNFFMPLVGIDWNINERNNLFGVLPGNLIFEHKVNHSFYYGTTFRAITSSFRLVTNNACSLGDCSGKNYLRINDNQIGAFADVYLIKKIVITPEIGYTAFRDYRYGFKGNMIHLKTDNKSDNYYFRISLNYRLRF